ncbi:PGR5-like protein 1A, chloroplastic [Porphyridium purpureum]|uniref:PGR5-like protein 1A, chloroplastic n=1 Tax=Porphyridium purpureum TaxID=35688 RepID=A0A5J4YP40_PORPP|nr:PGR5-like protein 1A, chloroplastic [Porphyridium purpureum]|eukprot:POR6470..scf296_7
MAFVGGAGVWAAAAAGRGVGGARVCALSRDGAERRARHAPVRHRVSRVSMARTETAQDTPVKLIEGEDGEMQWENKGRVIKPSLAEKENMFVDALYSFYAGKPLMSNDDFDALKEDLSWQGSQTVTLSRDELTLLAAVRSYSEGTPIMNDKEFDELKDRLRKQGSKAAIQVEPKCSIIQQACWSDCVEDNTRKTVLYLPGTGIGALIWAVVAFEFTPLRDESPLISLLVGMPFILLIGRILTETILPDPLILQGKCPNCASDQHVYFGTIATVEGYTDMAEVVCTNCSSKLTLDRAQRRFRLDMSKK